MADLEGVFSDPNGPAYQRTETRTGPPLDYVAGKLRACLEAVHSLHADAARHAVGCLPANRPPGSPYAVSAQDLECGTHAALHYAVVAYLALNNMLALANSPDLVNQLLGMSRDEFKVWLDRIDREGLVTGS